MGETSCHTGQLTLRLVGDNVNSPACFSVESSRFVLDEGGCPRLALALAPARGTPIEINPGDAFFTFLGHLVELSHSSSIWPTQVGGSVRVEHGSRSDT